MYPFMYIYLGPIQPACCRVQYSCLAIYTGLFIYRCILYIGIFVYIYVYSFVYICIYLGPVQTGVLQGAVLLFGDLYNIYIHIDVDIDRYINLYIYIYQCMYLCIPRPRSDRRAAGCSIPVWRSSTRPRQGPPGSCRTCETQYKWGGERLYIKKLLRPWSQQTRWRTLWR